MTPDQLHAPKPEQPGPHPADYPNCVCDDCEAAYIAPPRVVAALRLLLALVAVVIVASVVAGLM